MPAPSELADRSTPAVVWAGYSALSYLKKYPFDLLKIDRAFVAGVTESDEDTTLVSGILAMGHALGLEVIAEGVETEQQLAFLRMRRCDFAPDFYLRRPVAPDAMAELFKCQNVISA